MKPVREAAHLDWNGKHMNPKSRKLNKRQRLERCAIIRSELVKMSRNGWRDAKPCDYEPLERELRTLEERGQQ